MSESILPALSRGVGDRSTGPRIAISKLVSSIISQRIKSQLWFSSNTPLFVTENSNPSLNSSTNLSTRNAFTSSQEAAESFAASISHEVSPSAIDTELLSELFILLGDSDETVRKISLEVFLNLFVHFIQIVYFLNISLFLLSF